MKPPVAGAFLSALFVIALAWQAPSRADVIELKDGVRLEGQVLSGKCQACNGQGLVDCRTCTGSGLKDGRVCPACAGAKRTVCADCGGTGVAGGKVRIRVRAGVIEIDRAEVRRVTWQAVDLKTLLPAAEYYRQALAKLDAKDAQAAYDLAVWCAANGMETEARKHFAAAAILDPAMGPLAAPHLAGLARLREAQATKELLAAVTLLEQKGAAEGAEALRSFQKDYGETELGRRPELQRDLVRRQFAGLAAGGAATVDELLRACDDRLAARCEACDGNGREKCAACAGTGEGRCPDCAASGQAACPVCNASGKLTCPRCYGTGYSKGGAGLGYNFERVCPECNGQKEVSCDVCEGKGKRPCKRCGGSGRVAGGCPDCAGQGTITCRKCGGSGTKPVEKFAWGPPPVRQPGIINVGGGGGRERAWQGRYAGGVITALPAETLHRGALGAAVGEATGKKLRVLAVALDNRKGQKLLRFRAADRSLRGVTGEHGQVEAVDLAKLLGPKVDAAQVRAIREQAGDRDCLPGAYECGLVALPENADLKALSGLFWVPGGEAEPVRLAPIWLSDDEVAELRKSLR